MIQLLDDWFLRRLCELDQQHPRHRVQSAYSDARGVIRVVYSGPIVERVDLHLRFTT